MQKVVIVGSGASGVHFALSLLKKGYEVLMLDVGYRKSEPVNSQDTFTALKCKLADPVEYFLGSNFESVIYPDNTSEYYGFPPSKDYVFSQPPQFSVSSSGFAPLFSFARGGLAEAWAGGVHPLNDAELIDFPFSYGDIAPYYDEVADRIGVTGAKDDLTRFYPYHANILEPLQLDRHSELLLLRYEKRRSYLNNTLNCYMGRSRVATLSGDSSSRKGCTYTGRCLWGCPTGALYTPSITLDHCRQFSNFTYVPNMHVLHFNFNTKRYITSVIAQPVEKSTVTEFPLDTLILAAGTLSSSKIFVDSIFKNTGEVIKLLGLMDNRQVLLPFVNINMVGKEYEPATYQYHQLAFTIAANSPKKRVHAQITTLKTALTHPIIQKFPFDLKSSLFLFRNIHSALGIVNLNFPDFRRMQNYVTIEPNKKSLKSRLLINYLPAPKEKRILQDTLGQVKKILFKLGCIAPDKLIHVRPMGASVHYSGTLPMSRNPKAFTTSDDCKSHDFNNLYLVDGSTFPFLPAKNLTFTLMANAVRVAEIAF